MTDKIYTEDCLQTMKRMGDDVVDTVITSPPYNMGLKLQKGQYAKRNDNNHYTNKYQDSLSIDEYFEWQKTVITELLRVTNYYRQQTCLDAALRAFFSSGKRYFNLG